MKRRFGELPPLLLSGMGKLALVPPVGVLSVCLMGNLQFMQYTSKHVKIKEA